MREKQDYLGHRERLKARYIQGGYKAFQDYEVLELLLTYAIPRKDVKPLAKELIKKYTSLEKIFASNIDELSQIKGIGESTGIFLTLIGDIIKNIHISTLKKEEYTKLNSKTLLINYLKSDIGFSDVEEFKVIFLDIGYKLIKTETLFYGTIDRSAVYPREIIKKVLEHRAKFVVFAHNHPSGNTTPSKSDIDITKHMKTALSYIDVELIDHIIIGGEEYFSFYDNGILN